MKPSDNSLFLPDLCALRPLFVLVLGALVLALVLTLAQGVIDIGIWSEFSIRALYILWICLTASGLMCLSRRLMAGLSPWLVGFLSWLLILLSAWLVAEASIWLTAANGRADKMVRTLVIAAILGAALLRYLFESHQKSLREQAESRARLQALQARIRPHFLFNSLNTVISLIRGEPGKAETLLYDLSDLFRAALADGAQMSRLDHELELARQYLEIEKQRLDRRLEIIWDMDGLPGDLPMLSLVLQPLLENAIYHGVEPSATGGEVRISGWLRDGLVVLSLANSMPLDSESSKRKGNQMALENIRQRLELQYGQSAGLSTTLVDGKFVARLHFPARSRP